MKNDEEVLIYADWFQEPIFLGILYCVFGNGKSVYSFEYSKKWLSRFSNIILVLNLYNK